MCGDLFSLNYGREVVCLFLSLSLSLSLFVKNLCFVLGSKTFALLVSSSCRLQKRRYSRFPFLVLKPIRPPQEEREERGYITVFYTTYVCDDFSLCCCCRSSKKKKKTILTKMMMTTTKTKAKTTYDGTAKSAFGSGNVEGQSSVSFDDLIRAQSVGIDAGKIMRQSRLKKKKKKSHHHHQVEENEMDVGVFFFIIFFFFTAGRTVERFSIRVAPDDRVREKSEGERCFGRLRVRAKDDAEVLMFRNREEEKRL